jgi:hypothetical protein
MKTLFKKSCATILLIITTVSAANATLIYDLMLSSRQDQVAGRDAFFINYDSFNGMLNSPAAAPGAFSGINVSSSYIANGLVYDGQYRFMLSSRSDLGAGNDAFFITYNSFDSLLNSPAAAPGVFSGINVSSGYMATGLAFDGQYRLMLSARDDQGMGNDVFILTYDSFDDLINSPAAAPGDFSGINISSDYQASGLTYDGQYRLMLSSREDQGAGKDVFVVTYDSFDDLLNSPAAAPGNFSGINVSSDYIASGLAYIPSFIVPDVSDVPEPDSGLMVLVGLGLLVSTRRRYKSL